MAFNDKEELTITISGKSRSGKSVIAGLLTKYLKELGFYANFDEYEYCKNIEYDKIDKTRQIFTLTTKTKDKIK